MGQPFLSCAHLDSMSAHSKHTASGCNLPGLLNTPQPTPDAVHHVQELDQLALATAEYTASLQLEAESVAALQKQQLALQQVSIPGLQDTSSSTNTCGAACALRLDTPTHSACAGTHAITNTQLPGHTC